MSESRINYHNYRYCLKPACLRVLLENYTFYIRLNYLEKWESSNVVFSHHHENHFQPIFISKDPQKQPMTNGPTQDTSKLQLAPA